MLKTSENLHTPCYALFAVYLTCLLLTVVLANRLTLVGSFLEPGGIFVFPLLFPICDVVAEVYGYRFARLFVVLGWFSAVSFAVLGILISHLPSPEFFINKSAYEIVFNPTLRFVGSSLVGVLVGELLNIYFLTKWKVRLKGRFFMSRALLSTAIGQALISIVVDTLAFSGKMPIASLIWMMFCGFSVKMAYTVLLTFPAWLLVKRLNTNTLSSELAVS